MQSQRLSRDTGRLRANLEDELIESILAASRVIIGVAARSLGTGGEEITLQQFRALVLLDVDQTLRPADLASALSVDASTVTRLCDRLVAKKLISRRRGEVDRREIQLRLTAAGHRLLNAVSEFRRSEIAQIISVVPPNQYAGLTAAFTLFGSAAGEVSGGNRTEGEITR